MRQPLVRSFCLCLALLFFALHVQAQNPSRNDPNSGSSRNGHVIRGKIFLPGGGFPERRMRVVLEVTTGGIFGEVFSDSVGNFEFRSLGANNYRVLVPGDNQTYETATEAVEVSGPIARTFSVQIYLREKNSAQMTKDKMISSFIQDVPKSAKKNFEQGVKKLKDGKNDEAFVALQAAIKEFPDYVMAHDKLGQFYFGQQKFAEAQAEFEKALFVGPKYALSHVNLGMLLTQQKRFDEALEHLEIANRLDDNYPMAHMYLGIIFLEKSAQQPEKLDSAERAFQRAITLGGNSFAQVHKYIFNIQMRRKDYGKATSELESYLAVVPNAPDAPQIKETIEKLKKAVAAQPAASKSQ